MPAVGARETFEALGTTAVVLVADAFAAPAARAAVEAEIAAIDTTCSRFRPDSELVALNAAAGRTVPVSPTLYDALAVACRAARLTNGLVDPTVGAAIAALGYDRDFATVERRDGHAVVALGPVPGWRGVELDAAHRTVRTPPGVVLDLGATAKALCADRAATAAAVAVGSGVLVSLGGDIACAGPPPSGGWDVKVTDDHAAPPDAPGQTVRIESGGLATSSTTVRRWDRGGRELHHVVDPATGWPAETVWRTVSVAAATCVDANTATTAALLLGTAAPAWLWERNLPARLVTHDGRVVHVGGWPEAH